MRHRELGRDATWYLEVAAYLVNALEQPGIADSVLDNSRGPVADLAAHVLRLVGWLP